jgi:hypothetical protein
MTVTIERLMPYTVGVDLGQSQDFTAITVLERTDTVVDGASKERRYAVRHLQRVKLGTGYVEIVEIVKRLMKALPRAFQQPGPRLIVDHGGPGRPVSDLMTTCVSITGAKEEGSGESSNFTVPKRNLVSALKILFESGKIKIARDLPFAEDFIRELLEFRVKISNAGHDSYEAVRAATHDDLVISVALAAWWNERKTFQVGYTNAYIGHMER